MCWWSCLLGCAGSIRSAVDRCNVILRCNISSFYQLRWKLLLVRGSEESAQGGQESSDMMGNRSTERWAGR
jgi:hypothetical protein